MKVSVIIPCYNAAAYIGEAIASALAQSIPPTEVIVVDDGSTDDSVRVAKAFGSCVRVFIQEKKGPSAARNCGVSEARGELVAFLDADDRWLPDKLERQLALIGRQSDIGLVYCGYRTFGIDSEQKPANEGRITLHDLLECNLVGTLTVVARRDAVLAVGGFDETMGAEKGPCEDWDLWLRISAKYPVVGVGGILAEYRVHLGGVSRDARRLFDCAVRVLGKNAMHHGDCRECRLAIRSGLRRLHRGYAAHLAGAARTAAVESRYLAAVRHTISALWHDPSVAKRLPVAFLHRRNCQET